MPQLVEFKDGEEIRTDLAELIKPLTDELAAIDPSQPDALVRIAMVRRQLMRLAGID